MAHQSGWGGGGGGEGVIILHPQSRSGCYIWLRKFRVLIKNPYIFMFFEILSSDFNDYLDVND